MGPDNSTLSTLPFAPQAEPNDPEFRNYKQERKLHMVNWRASTAGTLRYQRVPMCGHKLVPGQEPRHRNCESCWFTFFNVHGELTQACDEVFTNFGEHGLKQLRGSKFTKNFTKFMSTVAIWKKAADAAKETTEGTGVITGGEDSTSTASGSGGDSPVATGDDSSETVQDIGL